MAILIGGGGGGGGGAAGNTTSTDTYANIPAAGTAGNLFFPSDGAHVFRDTGAAWAPWGPLFPLTVPPTAGWSWDNQGTATVTASGGRIYFLAPTRAGTDLPTYHRAQPATPYNIDIYWSYAGLMMSGNLESMGCCFRESSSGKLLSWVWSGEQTGTVFYYVTRWTDSDNISATPEFDNYNSMPPFMRMSNDGSDLFFYGSADGENWLQYYTEAKGAFFDSEPDQVGICAYLNNIDTTKGSAFTVFSWKES